MRTYPTKELIFEDCFVSEENILGRIDEGFKLALSSLERGRITIAAIACGLAKRALKEAVKYALERKQFGKALLDFQGLEFLVSDLATELEASIVLVEKAARICDQKRPISTISSMAKLKATDMAMKLTTEAVQILGGVGITTEFPLERYMRDAKILQIVEGANQIQKVIIAKNIKKEFS